jgi:hypothetical protein
MMNLFWTFCLIPDVFAKEEDSLLEELGLTRHGIVTRNATRNATRSVRVLASAHGTSGLALSLWTHLSTVNRVLGSHCRVRVC